eukprot:GEMP01000038.1.p1 GENE.GEMP01000038.1~~GEMP01000038.1.p1  ORF type:complete len:4044 (+),score=1094.81 GEMP01000038.1:434-12565(+)
MISNPDGAYNASNGEVKYGLPKPNTLSTLAMSSKSATSDSSLDENARPGEGMQSNHAWKGDDTVEPKPPQTPAPFFKAMMDNSVGVFLQFGGQGHSYFEELSQLYLAHSGISTLIESCSARMVREASHPDLQRSGHYAHYGIDVVSWITNADTKPPAEYLVSAPVSYALIGLTQLAHYAHFVHKSGVPFKHFVQRVKGATGHSQGLMAAVVAGTSACEVSFAENLEKMVAYLLWHGARLQTLVNKFVPTTKEDAQRFMLSVSGLSREALGALVEEKMKHFQLAIALENGLDMCVVSGTPQALKELKTVLTKLSAPSGDAQGRVPFSKRKPIIFTKWINATVPFHHHMLRAAEPVVIKDAQRIAYTIPSSAFVFPVYGTDRAADDLSALADVDDVFPRLVRMQVSECVIWASSLRCATNACGVSHVLDFGPGGMNGVGVLSQRLVEGAGVEVIHASEPAERDALLRTEADEEGGKTTKEVQYAPNWAQLFGPTMVNIDGDGEKYVVSTKWTKLLGKPPIMIAGMTPSTSFNGLDLVAAASNSGFHCELAAGGLSRLAMFEERVKKLCSMLNDGVGVILNMLYLSAQQWAFQFPAAIRMRKNGIPIESITIGAGVPSLEKGNDILQQMRACGMRYISFKPGSMEAIDAVLDIAAANPDFIIVFQWTGGRGGGHHSFEDMHHPILQAYSRIRALANMVLVAGSGFGDAEGSLPYLTGEWSTAFGYPPMPFDCVLLASRVMIAEEAATATAVKEIIVATQGVGADQAKWESSYEGNAGGIITVKSELGEPIHIVATRGMLLWREFDTMFFKAPLKDRHALIVKKKDYIIKRLNEDFQKVYFGRKENGVVCDLAEMTYAEVLHRFVALCYINADDEVESKRHERWTPDGRWIDVTYMTRLESWFHRCEAHVNAGNASFLRAPIDLTTRPQDAVRAFVAQSPQLSQKLLITEDIDVFLHLCKTGGKPVPFIPIIDGQLELWFKKDSLWYSEDIAAVPDHDAQRVCILQGPVSVAHCTVVNEPVASILHTIHHGWIAALKTTPPTKTLCRPVAISGGEAFEVDTVLSFDVHDDDGTITVSLPGEGDLPAEMHWRAFLGGKEDTWMKALLTSTTLVRGKKWFHNMIRSLFKPRHGQKVEIYRSSKDPAENSIQVFDARERSDGHAVLDARVLDGVVTVTINDVCPATLDTPQKIVPLRFYMAYRPDQPFASLHEVAAVDHIDEVKQYYAKLWFGDDEAGELDVRATHRATFCITQRDVKDFNTTIAASALDSSSADSESTTLDFCIVAAWKPLLMCVFPKTVRGNILDLVHLNNGYKMLDVEGTDNRSPLRVGDVIHSAMQVTEITNTASGKMVKCVGTLTRGEDSGPMVELTSSFLFRGDFTDFHNCFKLENRVASLDVRDDALAAILRSKDWFHPMEGEEVMKGDRLEFVISSENTFTTSPTTMRITARGTVCRASTGVQVASVHLEMENVAGNAVAAFLDRWEVPVEKSVVLENGGYTLLREVDCVIAPSSNIPYAIASRDLNPIHRNRYITDVAGLSSTIVHGMWTSANGRRVVQRVAGSPDNIRSYSCSFERMVTASEKLYTQVTHIGNKNGRMIVTVDTCTAGGDVVLKGRAEVEHPRTAYVFTGQGSQEKGMGMELYARSKPAKAVWDTAETSLYNMYGFSILDIVRNNPQSVTVHFGGQKGAAIRRAYMALTKVGVDGQQLSLIPAIDARTEWYTFNSPHGLLFATQFAQPAIMLMECAAFADMKDKGLIPSDHVVAGHSLGEYAALTVTSNILSIETLSEIVFLRGMTMQSSVPRDAQGRSDYGMIAANPSRVGAHFTEEHLKDIIKLIDDKSNMLLEVVNYNMRGAQYIVAGNLQTLATLGDVMTQLQENPARLESVDELITAAIDKAEERARALSMRGDVLTLERGKATIPLAGVDVPFHSKCLLPGVSTFRTTIEERIGYPNSDKLIGRYVPNLTAVPLSLSKEYVTLVFELTKSPRLRDVLADWVTFEDPAMRNTLGRTLVIELLAYQFASPVRWIETQDYFFTAGNVQRLIEIGPVPTLKNMALRTLASGSYGSLFARSMLHYAQDHDEIFFEIENRGPSCEAAAKADAPVAVPEQHDGTPLKDAAASAGPSAPMPALPAPPVAQTPMPTPSLPTTSAAAVPDCPVTALEALQIIVATKVKKNLSDVPASVVIKDLCGGKSVMQNEILGDLSKEFGDGPENSADIPLSDLSKGYSSYKPLGKYTTECIAKLVLSTMPGGFVLSAMKQYLAEHFDLGAGRVDGVLLHALSVPPAARLGTERDAHAWLDGVVESYATKVGVTLRKDAASMPAMHQMMVPMMMGGGAAALQPISDAPVSATDFIKTILALKLKIPFASITDDKTLKELTGGKSAMQNEILADISSELGDATIDNAGDMCIGDFGKFFPSYSTLGKVSMALTSKMFSSKMPGGFGMSAVQTHLTEQRLLPPGRVESVLLHALVMQPESRLANDNIALAWLDSVVDSFGAIRNLTIPKAGSMGTMADGMQSMDSGVPSKALDALEKRLKVLLDDTIDSQLEFLKKDKHSAAHERDAECLLRKAAEKELELWSAEHGDFYRAGITPVFSAQKQRTYDSYWNWARTDVIRLHNSWLADGRRRDDNTLTAHIAALIANRGNTELVTLVDTLRGSVAESDEHLKHFLELLKDKLTESLQNGGQPACRAVFESFSPQTTVVDIGRIEYSEVPRPGISCVDDYIAEMKRGFQGDTSPARADEDPSARAAHRQHATTVKSVPHISIETVNPTDPTRRVFDHEASEDYFAAMKDLAGAGITLSGKIVLVTGCGVGSIGIELVKYFLQAGAHVIATTSAFSFDRSKFFRTVYEENCSMGSALTLLPFNQGSVQDVASLVSHVYDVLKLDLNYVVPFAAISENGSDISAIEGRNELSHRVMLTNTVRLLGAISSKKEQNGIKTRPATVLLPLSPNHGMFGNDGLYAESKLALEALLAKWCSESWSDFLSIIGVVIGWTRGTGLMSGNNMVAADMEKLGLRTFSQTEMAFNLMALFHPSIVSLSQQCPVVVNIGGGFDMVRDLKGVTEAIRAELYARATVKRGITADNVADNKVTSTSKVHHEAPIQQAATFQGTPFPALPSVTRVSELGTKLQGMVDLDKVVVCVGYGEVGPWGSARTRWEMESYGRLSLEGCVELAWMLGYIRYHNGPLPSKAHHIGWVDAVTNEPVHDMDVKARYEEEMLSHAGVRFVEFDGGDPANRDFFQQIALDRGMPPFEVSDKEEAEAYRTRVGADYCTIYQREEDGTWCVLLKKGAVVTLPRTIQFSRFYAGQIPRGWSAARLGVPQDIINQVDPVTLFTLVSTVEAFIAAGITDPYEFYKYVHVSQVGNTTGSGMGGLGALRSVFCERSSNAENKTISSDVLQETFINTTAAWVNMLLLSSSGPIKTPVGACATAAESVEIGMDIIAGGKASVVIVGGCDDIRQESMYEFASMKATSDSLAELAKGRDPREMSRPCSSTRAGFMESHGSGNQILMSAALALQMGVPIYAIIAHTATATDKEGRSVPAPGKGILTSAREVQDAFPSPSLSIEYRRRRLNEELDDLDLHRAREIDYIAQKAKHIPEKDKAAFLASRVATLDREITRTRKCIQNRWGNEFYVEDPTIAPLRGALAVWDLTIDDIDMASFHGTSTTLNDKNESDITHRQMEHLGRTLGKPLYVVAQKSLTGHPKGAAAAWMFNGCVQALQHQRIPGNYNLDSMSLDFQQYTHLVYPNKPIKLGEQMKACMLKSFGFGQVNAEILLVHPDYVFGVATEEFAPYVARRAERETRAFRYMQNVLTEKHALVQIKSAPPYSVAMQEQVYLNPLIRASYDTDAGTYTIADGKTAAHPVAATELAKSIFPTIAPSMKDILTPAHLSRASMAVGKQLFSKNLKVVMSEAAEGLRHKLDKGIGLDVEPIASFSDKNEDFLRRNFTDSELEYCAKAPDTSASLAGRWAAKEATIKAISDSCTDSRNLWKSSGSPLKDIEVVMSKSGAPTIRLHNYAKDVANALGISEVKISISHTGDTAVSQAVAI